MTDNTQELDEIFDKMGYTKNTDFRKEAIRLITDWHNKQIDETVRMIHGRHDIRCAKCYEELGIIKPEEAVLDRLESLNGSHPDSYIATFIQAERKKLKESK